MAPVTHGLSAAATRPAVTWQTGPLRTWTAPIDSESSALRRQLESAGDRAGVPPQEASRPPLELFSNWLNAAWWLVLAMAVFGPRPRFATRWGAFWRVLMPLNTGAWLILLREAPWNLRAAAAPEPSPHKKRPGDQRLTGWPASVWFAVTSVLVLATWPMVITALQSALDGLLG